MQQTYFCPRCSAPVAYGQPYCTYCSTVLSWPGQQPPQQNPPNSYEQQGQQSWGQQPPYGQQQYGWDQQQQWGPSQPDNQQAGWGYGGQYQQAGSNRRIGRQQKAAGKGAPIGKIVTGVVIVAVLAVAGIAMQGEIGRLTSKPVVESFRPSTGSITSGQSTNLQWSVTGASSVSISPGIGTVASSGTAPVAPDKTTTYTLTAKNTFGSAQASASIAVSAVLPAIDSFSSDPESIVTGQKAKLSWSVAGADSVSITPDVGNVEPVGDYAVTPKATTTYTLTATSSAGNSKATATVTVAASAQPLITAFGASPASIKAGESSTLNWDVVGSTSINIDQGIGGVGSQGSRVVTPLATTTYTLTAAGATKSVTVTVDTSSVKSTTTTTVTSGKPQITAFTVSPATITLAEPATLTWAVTGVRGVTISPGVGPASASGSMPLVPTGTTTYTLLATNNFGTENATATVTVNLVTENVTAPAILSFTATPASITAGATSSLSWNIQNATTITIDHGIGTPASHFSETVSPAETTTYTLTALNSAGIASAEVTVTVP